MSQSIKSALMRIGSPRPQDLFHATLNQGVRIDGHASLEQALRRTCVAACFWLCRLRAVFLDGADPRTLPPKENILLVGPTGSGKSFLAETVFGKVLGLPFAMEDMSQFTCSGYVGRDVPGLLARLVTVAGDDIDLASIGVLCLDEIDKICRSRSEWGRDIKGDVAGELLRLVSGGETLASFRSGYCGPSGDDRPDIILRTENLMVVACGAFSGMERFVAARVSDVHKSFGFVPAVVTQRTEHAPIIPDDLINFGLSAELVGRFGHVVELPSPPHQLLRRLADDEVERRASLWKAAGCELPESFRSGEFINQAVDLAMKRPTGARAIPSVVAELMTNAAFTAFSAIEPKPSSPTVQPPAPESDFKQAAQKPTIISFRHYGCQYDFAVSFRSLGMSIRIESVSVRLAAAPWKRLVRLDLHRRREVLSRDPLEFAGFDVKNRFLVLNVKPTCDLKPKALMRAIHAMLTGL